MLRKVGEIHPWETFRVIRSNMRKTDQRRLLLLLHRTPEVYPSFLPATGRQVVRFIRILFASGEFSVPCILFNFHLYVFFPNEKMQNHPLQHVLFEREDGMCYRIRQRVAGGGGGICFWDIFTVLL